MNKLEEALEKTKAKIERQRVVDIYRRMLKQAEIYRQRMQKELNDCEQGTADHYADMSSELWYWVAELENTEEVNPTK